MSPTPGTEEDIFTKVQISANLLQIMELNRRGSYVSLMVEVKRVKD